jgi:hypothetical protein
MSSDNYYHECGHVIVALIFADLFYIEFVTVNVDYSNSFDPLSKGGLKGRINKPVKELTPLDHDKLILIMISGMCIDDLVNNNRQLPENIYETGVWANKMNQYKYGGDVELILAHFQSIKESLSLSWVEYVVNILKFAHKILNDETVWGAITNLRNSLIVSSKQTLMFSQIEKIIAGTNLSEWIAFNKEHIENERSSIFIEKLGV